MKLSVIVPVYNVEKFLPRCLDSLLRQGLDSAEYEVICVNDGSPDNSSAILAEYERKYPDVFKIIAQENMGVGEARNTGMKVARGEWITFLDSDDYVTDGGYKFILDHFCDEGVDVVHFNWLHVYTDGKTLYDSNAKPDGEIVFDGDAAIVYNQRKLPYTCVKFYYRPFLLSHHICFEASSFMEDESFNFDVFLQHPRLRVVSSNIYRYEQGNPNSSLTTVNKEKVKKQLELLLYMVEKMQKYLQEGDGILESAALRNAHTFSVHYYNKMLKAGLTWSEWRQCSQPIKSQRIYKCDVSLESSFIGKLIALLKNGSGSFYMVYFFTAFFVYKIFLRWIRPRVVVSNS